MLSQKLPLLKRTEGWETRLQKVITNYQNLQFIWGKTDCIIFIADCLQALTEEDVLYEARNAYTTKIQGYNLRKTKWNDRFQHLWESRTTLITNPNMAMRGDIVIANYQNKEHCGVVSGKHILLRTNKGLLELPLSEQKELSIWRAG